MAKIQGSDEKTRLMGKRLGLVRCQIACYNKFKCSKWVYMLMYESQKEGPKSSSIPELIDKTCHLFCDIVFYQNPKFEVCKYENGENTRLRNVKSPS
jgi:hypothetical protein